uniref:BTBDG BTB/POZ domain-containing protein n=2 Tax=Octopus bimaculoides TaxID=37653 RepID=A0A0L8HI38_OCTBM
MNNKLRMRKQVGLTNRWRLPEPLGSDLLGTSQALRAISTPLNETLIKIITAESPQIAVNLDLNQPYKFRQIQDRPTTASLYSPSYKKTKTLPEARKECSTPSVFSYCTKRNAMKPDISLHCLGVRWNLHSSNIDKSSVLLDLFVRPRGKSNDSSKQGLLRKPKSASDIHLKSRSSKILDNRLTVSGIRRNSADSALDLRDYIPAEMFHMDLEAEDPKLTKKGLAVALASLYQDEVELTNVKQIIPVLAAAHLLQMKELTDK